MASLFGCTGKTPDRKSRGHNNEITPDPGCGTCTMGARGSMMGGEGTPGPMILLPFPNPEKADGSLPT
jgi:hypothetical protein